MITFGPRVEAVQYRSAIHDLCCWLRKGAENAPLPAGRAGKNAPGDKYRYRHKTPEHHRILPIFEKTRSGHSASAQLVQLVQLADLIG
jgi:hypothetical protein